MTKPTNPPTTLDKVPPQPHDETPPATLLRKARFWEVHVGESFNDRQRKIVNRLLTLPAECTFEPPDIASAAMMRCRPT